MELPQNLRNFSFHMSNRIVCYLYHNHNRRMLMNHHNDHNYCVHIQGNRRHNHRYRNYRNRHSLQMDNHLYRNHRNPCTRHNPLSLLNLLSPRIHRNHRIHYRIHHRIHHSRDIRHSHHSHQDKVHCYRNNHNCNSKSHYKLRNHKNIIINCYPILLPPYPGPAQPLYPGLRLPPRYPPG